MLYIRNHMRLMGTEHDARLRQAQRLVHLVLGRNIHPFRFRTSIYSTACFHRRGDCTVRRRMFVELIATQKLSISCDQRHYAALKRRSRFTFVATNHFPAAQLFFLLSPVSSIIIIHHHNHYCNPMDILSSMLDLMRRLPPTKIEENVEALMQISPDYAEDLSGNVDQPLKLRVDRATGKEYLACVYNQDGESYRCVVSRFCARARGLSLCMSPPPPPCTLCFCRQVTLVERV